MPVITATEVTIYSNISASAATITSSGLIPIVQERITQICNSYFTTDIMIIDDCDFATAGTITLRGGEWEDEGFANGDEIYIKNSYRNDGYVTVSSFVDEVATLSVGSVVPELSGRSVLFSMVKWPQAVKQAAALMVAYDYDTRPKQTPGVKSFNLGPFGETYTATDVKHGMFGYPQEVLGMLPLPVVSML